MLSLLLYLVPRLIGVNFGSMAWSIPGSLYYCTLGTSDFDAQMCGIKFWNGDEKLRPVYKNHVFLFFVMCEEKKYSCLGRDTAYFLRT